MANLPVYSAFDFSMLFSFPFHSQGYDLLCQDLGFSLNLSFATTVQSFGGRYHPETDQSILPLCYSIRFTGSNCYAEA